MAAKAHVHDFSDFVKSLAMEMHNIPFGVTDWSSLTPERHAGLVGYALWRTQNFNNIRVRMVEYSAGYLADHCIVD